MTALTDKTITNYITNKLQNLPSTIKQSVEKQYNSLKEYINTNKPTEIIFIDCIDIYIFGVCLINTVVNLDDITTVLDTINDIFIEINTYLYKKQYASEKYYTSYEPDTKAFINTIINNDKKYNNNFLDITRVSYTDINFENLNNVAIPKLEKDINTEPKLLKTSGLMNSEIANLIGDGHFNNVATIPLISWSLSNQFVVRCRKSQYYYLNYYNGNSNDLNEINKMLYKNFINDDNQPVINKYYLFHFMIKDKKIDKPIFLLNSIAHLEFKAGYLSNLKRKLTQPINERYIFTFGTFSCFKSSITDNIGYNHRCALIFDRQEKKIYFFDTLLETQTNIYLFKKNYYLYNSIHIACKYKFSNIDFINNYEFVMANIYMQYHDMKYKEIIRASTYYRYYRKKNTAQPNYMDWSGGYCGTYVLLLLVMISINPYIDLLKIFSIFQIITNSDIANHNFLIALIRSFAFQIENIIYNRTTTIQLNSFDFNKYIESEGAKIILNKNIELNLTPGAHDYKGLNPLKPTPEQESIAKQIVRDSNKGILHENKDKIIDMPLQSIYLYNLSLMFTTIGSMFKNINKMQTEFTQEQRQWQFDHYGPGDLVYFIKV